MSRIMSSTVYDYDFMDQIGVGSFGCVYRAKHKLTNSTVAVKVMKKKGGKSSENNHWQEYKTMKRLSHHPNIVHLYEGFTGPTKELYFVMEFMNGGNLYQYLKEQKENGKQFNEAQVRIMLRQILGALASIHDQGYFHRDLKPENLLVETNQDEPTQLTIKLADFGLARELKSKAPYTDYVSTRWYRSPEVLLKASVYSSPVDIWAVGVIMAELFTLSPLFPGHSEIDQLYRICEVLGSPGVNIPAKKKNKLRNNGFTRRKSDLTLYSSAAVTSSSTKMDYHNETTCIGDGGEWKEGLRLAHKLGFQFPEVKPKGLSKALPTASNLMIDLIRRLLLFDPGKRLNARDALGHPFFIESIAINLNRPTSEQLDVSEDLTFKTSPNTIISSSLPSENTTSSYLDPLPFIPLSSLDFSDHHHSATHGQNTNPKPTATDDSLTTLPMDHNQRMERYSTSFMDLQSPAAFPSYDGISNDNNNNSSQNDCNDSFENVIERLMCDLRDTSTDISFSDTTHDSASIFLMEPCHFKAEQVKGFQLNTVTALDNHKHNDRKAMPHLSKDGHSRHDSLDFINELNAATLPVVIRPSFSSPLNHNEHVQQRRQIQDHQHYRHHRDDYHLHHHHEYLHYHPTITEKKKSNTSISQFFGLRKKFKSGSSQRQQKEYGTQEKSKARSKKQVHRQEKVSEKALDGPQVISTDCIGIDPSDLSSKSSSASVTNGVPRTESFPSMLIKHITSSSSTSLRPNSRAPHNGSNNSNNKNKLSKSKEKHTSLQRRSSSMSILNIYYDGGVEETNKKKPSTKGFWSRKHPLDTPSISHPPTLSTSIPPLSN